MMKPPCGHTKYEGSAPCICSQFETYWREQIAKEILEEAKRCKNIEESRYSSEEYGSSRLAIFNDGHIGGLTSNAQVEAGKA